MARFKILSDWWALWPDYNADNTLIVDTEHFRHYFNLCKCCLIVPEEMPIQHSCGSSQWPLHVPHPDLDRLFHPQQRDIYVGSTMTKAAKARWQGNLQEVKVGMLIATPADDNGLGHQFWIGKVLDVGMHENEYQNKSIKVHWYNTRSKNAFTGKNTLEIMECPTSRGNRKMERNIRNLLYLDISEVDIIVYNFTLTKIGRLTKSTINIIK